MAEERKISIELTLKEVDGLVEICEHATAFCIDAGLAHKKESPKIWRKNFMAIAAKAREIHKELDENTKERRIPNES